MTAAGFRLTHLTLTGTGVPDAEVRFSRGLNVISGPSDTGKTFIAQCIDFMLGATKPPKEIPETETYESVLLGLRAQDDQSDFVLERSIRGGPFRLLVNGNDERVLGFKHQAADEDTISHFLLDLSGLAGRRVLMNKTQGKTRALSFRDLTRLILVDEESVISEASPIFSGQHIFRTAETSIFRLLLSGVDDSSVITKDDPKVIKERDKGKDEVLDVLVKRTREQIAEMELGGDAAALQEQLKSIEALFDQLSARLAAEQETMAALEERRRTAWSHMRQAESRIDVLSELQRRFYLLKEQYSSDLSRLDAISEAGSRLGQMPEERCPVCGAPAEHHDRAHQKTQTTPEDVSNACRAEGQKIRTLLADLASTLAGNAKEIERRATERDAMRAELQAATSEIRDRLEPRVELTLQELRNGQAQRDRYRRALEFYERVVELESMRNKTGYPGKTRSADGTLTGVGADEAERFSQEVESLLRAWRFPNLDRVTFSEKDQDIVISGHRRASHGKGVRAITHAAFNIGLLRYCRCRSMPHPGLVVVDSPLVVYREPDSDEGDFTPAVKDAFYRTLAAQFRDAQVIILENEDPPSDISNDAQVIRFTGTGSERTGFIPRVGA